VAVGEDATVCQQAGADHRFRILARSLSLDPPRKEFQADDARVVEGNDDARIDRPCAPQRLDEVGPLVRRNRVFKRFVGIAVPDIIEEGRSASLHSASSASTFAQPKDPSGHPGGTSVSCRRRKRA